MGKVTSGRPLFTQGFSFSSKTVLLLNGAAFDASIQEFRDKHCYTPSSEVCLLATRLHGGTENPPNPDRTSRSNSGS